ncbi:MAG: nucleotidyltransferase family protein [Gammaproteobacteria bacterium HGW-Gammaproteobacteria-3]|nr:MAG: nucleotidyltransferase family protein [Gammaproteobacteria bacterium HGW-Gammaproteobacteria-3]
MLSRLSPATTTDNVYAIVLAAGASKRLGTLKQLARWKNQTLLEHALQKLRSLLAERVIVVLGAHAVTIQAAVALDAVTTVVNNDWRQGVASSLRAGIETLPPSASAVLILLCDQPLISVAQLQTLLAAWQNESDRIVASEYSMSVGVPALFPAEFFPALRKLEGDQGAKRLLKEYAAKVIKISLPEAELDIDTPDDFDYLTGL